MTERPPDPPANPSELTRAVAAAKAEARRDVATAPSGGPGLAAEFRTFRRGQTLGGLKPKDLIAEGRAGELNDGT